VTNTVTRALDHGPAWLLVERRVGLAPSPEEQDHLDDV
jgi:hypothetical protein